MTEFILSFIFLITMFAAILCYASIETGDGDDDGRERY